VEERHLLTAILEDDEGVTLRTLQELGVDLAALQFAAARHSTTPTLDSLSRDLTQLALKGKLNPLVGRKPELRRLVRTLAGNPKTIRCSSERPGRQDGHRRRAGLIAAARCRSRGDARRRANPPCSSPTPARAAGSRSACPTLLEEIKRAGTSSCS
jgi:hypothetical protein